MGAIQSFGQLMTGSVLSPSPFHHVKATVDSIRSPDVMRNLTGGAMTNPAQISASAAPAAVTNSEQLLRDQVDKRLLTQAGGSQTLLATADAPASKTLLGA
jgi:hypothetical protein